ncbi:MAG: Eco57I restriction-modification methylase domain-containing protein, partial [Spirochaetes bacterium]|nr:Eco57I restriction-modification methylase domain-containing protein [Spirochaetota bacterium]
KIVYILQVVDFDGTLWRAKKLENVPDLYRKKIEEEFSSQTLDYIRKLEVIKNSIFGVDIQPIAVDVSRLRCFLTLVVESEIDDAKPNRGIEPLPNLDFKFVCANTLISLPKKENMGLFDDHSGIAELTKIMSEYFSCNSQNKNEIKLKFLNVQKEILEKTISAFGKNTGELTLKLTIWNPFGNTSNLWFDSEWMFGVEDGFDVVIGNPPYVDSETMVRDNPDLRVLYSSIYRFAKGNWDLFIIFIEQGIRFLNDKGSLSYIVPNKLIAAKYSESLRSYILTKNIKFIRDYSDVKVFKEASVYPIVFQISNFYNSYSEVELTKMRDIEKIELINNIPHSLFYEDIYWDKYFINPNEFKIISKISKNIKLEKMNNLIMGAATVGEAYKLKEIVTEMNEMDGEYKKLVNSGTIDPYKYLWGNKKTQYIKTSYSKPVVENKKLNQLLPNRFKQANNKKLIIAGMSKRLEVVYDYGECIAGKSTTIILDNEKIDLLYLLAILNSTLISYWYRIYFSSLSLAGGYLRISNNEIKKIPIVEPDKKTYKEIIKIVNQIHSCRENNNKDIGTESLESQIDQLVYKLYNLTPEEIETVENFDNK